ncbi:hypothetical protein QJS04_geneDACA004597 [Acorus gramineus]|uniref:Protein FAM32A n=1 Tax=Acorus gramineus TaxID=55184 RepID=A0AAV9BTW1_ACOGR|nr:hypothetical protein QJS04_geneDACA004597 [Acorus gramineus]
MGKMSEYDYVVGKLKLKGKALNVKAVGMKKKKKSKHHYDQILSQEGIVSLISEVGALGRHWMVLRITHEAEKSRDEGRQPFHNDHLTPAERRYIEQKAKIELRRMAKTANKSHRNQIQEFNQYLANLSEHYDIPKVGPG